MRVRTIAAATFTLLLALAPAAQADVPPAGEITCHGDTASVTFSPGVGLLETKQTLGGRADSADCQPLNADSKVKSASVALTGSSRASCALPSTFNVRNEKLAGTITWHTTDNQTATSQFSVTPDTADRVDINGQGMVVEGRITSGYETGKKVAFSTTWNRAGLLSDLLKCATFSFRSVQGELVTLHVFP